MKELPLLYLNKKGQEELQHTAEIQLPFSEKKKRTSLKKKQTIFIDLFIIEQTFPYELVKKIVCIIKRLLSCSLHKNIVFMQLDRTEGHTGKKACSFSVKRKKKELKQVK